MGTFYYIQSGSRMNVRPWLYFVWILNSNFITAKWNDCYARVFLMMSSLIIIFHYLFRYYGLLFVENDIIIYKILVTWVVNFPTVGVDHLKSSVYLFSVCIDIDVLSSQMIRYCYR